MLTNYFKIGWRHLVKNKVYSVLNIGGLAIGVMVAMLIGLWIEDELSFNKYHANYDRIASVMQNQTFNGGNIQTGPGQALQLAPELRNTYGASFKHIAMANFVQPFTLMYNEKGISKRGFFMEAEGPEILSLNMLSGTRSGLKELNSILLSEATAKALFGNEDPMNKVVRIDDWPEVKVTGIYEDLPHNTTFHDLSFISSWEMYKQRMPEWLNWGNSWFQTIVQIADNTDMATVSSIIKDAKLKRVSEEEGARFKPQLFLHPMSKWHLYSEFKNGVSVGGRIQYVWLFGIIGVFVLILACINFMNLSTARSGKRAMEIGIRKASGSVRSQLIYQFFIESILVAALAFVVSIVGVLLILPYFNEIADKEVGILWSNPLFWLMGVSFTLITGVLAGSYPALYLSSFRAVSVLKGIFKVGNNAAIPRKIMVVVQFTVSVTLIVGTIIVFQQINYVKNRPIGYSQNLLITVPMKNQEIVKHYETFRHELLETGAVEEVAKSDCPVTQTFFTNGGFQWEGKDPTMPDEFTTVRVSHDFGKAVGWQVKNGRDFSRDFASDSAGFIINEAAAAYMGLKSPIGEKITWGMNGTYTIIGVVDNMVMQSPYLPSKQTIFFIHSGGPKNVNFANIRIKANTSVTESLANIEAVFKKYDQVSVFDYSFVDREYAKSFGNEERIGKLAGSFAVLAIFISCLGVFGLSSFLAEQRTKEIGIRKVLGASVPTVWKLLSRDFIILVILSCVIAAPVAYYFLDGWLKQYDYRTQISYWVFIAASMTAIIITLFTVSFHSIKAAAVNPVKSLRSQ